MRYLKTNTAVIVTVGPFYDRTDGVTIENALTITNERITLTADTDAGSAPTLILDNVTGATSGTANDLNYITNCDAGLMQLELAAADVNRLGRLFLTITDAANHVPVFHEFTVLPAQVYDSLILGSDLLDANASQLGGTAQTGRDVGASVLLSPGTGTGQLSLSSGAVLLQATQTGVTIPTVTTVGTTTNLTNLPAAAATAAELAKVPKSDSTVSWNATALAAINAQADTAISDAALATAANLATVDTVVDAIKVKTDYLPSATAGAAGGVFIAGSNAATSITTALTANITGNLSGSVGSVTGAVGSVTGGVTVTTNNDKAGYSLAADQSAVTVGTTNTIGATGLAAIWDRLTSALTTVGSIGKLIVDNLNATISSRSTYAGADTAGTTTLLSRIVGTLATGTHNPQTGDAYARLGAPAGASMSADIAAVKADSAAILVDTGTTLDGRIPAALVSGRMDVSVGAMASNVVTAAALATDAGAEIADAVWDEALSGHTTGGSAGAALTAATAPTAAQNADAVWDELLSGHSGAGSAGNALATASSGGVDPSVLADAIWDEALSGHATAGTSGKKLTDLANADLSGVATATNLADLHTDVGTVLTNLATVDGIVDTITGHITADYGATEKSAIDLLDDAAGGLADIHTDIGTAQAMLTDIHGTDLPAVKSDTAAILVDTGTTLDGRIPAALVGGRMDASVGAMANNTLTAAALATDAVTEIQNGLATPTNITAGTITTVTNLTNAATNGDLTATMKTSVTTAASAATPAATVSDKTGFSLSAAGVDAILDEVVEGTLTMRQMLRLFTAAMAGKASGGGTAIITFRDVGDTKARVTLTVDADGNRSAVTLDGA